MARPAPGEEYNPGPPTAPRQAATVILLRGGGSALEVLLVQRSQGALHGRSVGVSRAEPWSGELDGSPIARLGRTQGAA